MLLVHIFRIVWRELTETGLQIGCWSRLAPYLDPKEDSSGMDCSRHKQGLLMSFHSTASASAAFRTLVLSATETTDSTRCEGRLTACPGAARSSGGAHSQCSPLPCSLRPGEASPAATPSGVWAWTGPQTSLPSLRDSPLQTHGRFHTARRGASTSASRGKSV